MNKRLLNCAIALAVTAGSTVMSISPSMASSHREAPNITRMPKVDSTDFYMFNSYEEERGDYVTLIANYIPLQDPQGGPNYFAMDPSALYEIHIDNDGDAIEDITFQFRFNNDLANGTGLTKDIGDETGISVPVVNLGGIGVSAGTSNLGFLESYGVTMVSGDRRRGRKQTVTKAGTNDRRFTKPFDYIGEKTFGSADDYADYANQYIYEVDIPGCGDAGKVFVGQRKESFAVNLGATFDLVNYLPIEGLIENNKENNDLENKNVTTIALEVPKDCLTGSSDGIIGAWTSASLRQVRILNRNATFEKPEVNGGAWTQVSRLSAPLVNELVIGIADKDRFSASEPKDDGQFLHYVTNPTLPSILNDLFDANAIAPVVPRNDLVAVFLTGVADINQPEDVTGAEMMRLDTNEPIKIAEEQSNLGVIGGDDSGFPNGRRPGDDVVDIALRVVMGRLCHITALCEAGNAPTGLTEYTDGALIDASDFDQVFPYLTTPVPGAVIK